jgi:hypothetical protein
VRTKKTNSFVFVSHILTVVCFPSLFRPGGKFAPKKESSSNSVVQEEEQKKKSAFLPQQEELSKASTILSQSQVILLSP